MKIPSFARETLLRIGSAPILPAMRSIPVRPLAFLLIALVAPLATACLHVPPAPLSPADSADRIESRSLTDPALRSFLSERLAQPVDAWPRPRWSVEDLTLVAIYFNPTLRVAQAGFEVARSHEKTAAQRPNPSLQIQPQYYVNNVASGVPPWLSVFNLNWTFETGSKRASRIAVAEATTRAAEANQIGAVWQTRGELTQAAIALRSADARQTRRARILELLGQRATLLEHRFAEGAASQNDLTLARQARLVAETLLATSVRAEAEARARLAAALGLPRGSLEGDSLANDLETEPASWTDAAALDAVTARHAAMLGRSDVLAGLADYDAAEANLRLQLAQQYPNIVFGPSYEYDQGGHRWGLNLSLNLPLLSRNEGGIEEAAAARSQTAARFEALQTRVLSEVDGATAALEGARGERTRTDELVRGSDQQTAYAARALAAGASDRATYLAAELAREDVGLLAIDADERVKLAIARLELAVRPLGPIDSILSASAAP